MKPSFIPLIVAALAAPTFAQLTDAPPVDMKQVLQGLKQFKEQNETGLRTRRNAAYQQIVAAAASNEKAAAFWTDAVLAVKVAGVDHETAAARGWTKGDGEGLKAKEGANAARLHLVWLALTLQHISDAETKQLLPSIIDFTKQLEADEAAITHFSEKLDKALDRFPGLNRRDLGKAEDDLEKMAARKPPVPMAKEALENVRARIIHDGIMRTSVASSVVAQKLQIVEILGDAGAKKQRKGSGGDAASWEPVPGNVNGIYNAIILPEFRATKDPRLMDYWDMKLRKEQEKITSDTPAFKEREWTHGKRPAMMWSRTQDMLLIGLRNRAITEMFTLIKTYPQHPDAAGWITQLEQIVTPAPAPVGTILNSGTVAPPTVIPAATTPGTPPTAVIVPAPPATR